MVFIAGDCLPVSAFDSSSIKECFVVEYGGNDSVSSGICLSS